MEGLWVVVILGLLWKTWGLLMEGMDKGIADVRCLC